MSKMIRFVDRTPIKPSHAILHCSDCGFEEQFTVAMNNVGQAKSRAVNHGWIVRGKKAHCPKCVEAKKAPTKKQNPTKQNPTKQKQKLSLNYGSIKKLETNAVTTQKSPSTAARAMRRTIIEYLDENYDTTKERYRGDWSDQKVATAAGTDVAVVAKLRLDLFGESSENEETKVVAGALKNMKAEAEKKMELAMKAAADCEAVIIKINTVLRKIEEKL